MKARAPGKLVLSGAYAVLWGAPALVTAVDRYVLADSARAADFVTPEVAAALEDRAAPWFDASALRSEGRKLGLGSSAAIVVASLGALAFDESPDASAAAIAARVFPVALAAHRKAQGGGSGIDVAASSFGGTLRCVLTGEELQVVEHELPLGVAIEAYADSRASLTPSMVAAVKRWAREEPVRFDALMQELSKLATRAASARAVDELTAALREQVRLLSALGDAANVPIVPAELRPLAEAASSSGIVVMPSGAGGGDIVLCVGPSEACAQWARPLEALGLERLRLEAGAPGLGRHEG